MNNEAKPRSGLRRMHQEMNSGEELEKTRRELDQVTKTMLSVEEDRDM